MDGVGAVPGEVLVDDEDAVARDRYGVDRRARGSGRHGVGDRSHQRVEGLCWLQRSSVPIRGVLAAARLGSRSLRRTLTTAFCRRTNP